jgi:hypothetical protein
MICVHLLPSVSICVEEQAQKTPLWITAGVLKVEVESLS